jgi:hypothetical protein
MAIKEKTISKINKIKFIKTYILFNLSQSTSKPNSPAIDSTKPLPTDNFFDSQIHETDIHNRVLKSLHCNRSDHTDASLKICKKLSSQAPSSTAATTSSPQPDCKNSRCKSWSKKRHKSKEPPNIEPNDSITPFIVSNMLDKL